MNNPKKITFTVNDEGFSLVELLVVIFIAGLMAGVVVLSLPNDNRSMFRAEDDMRNLVKRIEREAIISGYPIRWSLVGGVSVVEIYRDNAWQDYSAGQPLSAFNLSEGITVEVELIDFEPAIQNVADDVAEETIARSAPIVFLPTGETNEAVLTLSSVQDVVKLFLAPDGSIERDAF